MSLQNVYKYGNGIILFSFGEFLFGHGLFFFFSSALFQASSTAGLWKARWCCKGIFHTFSSLIPDLQCCKTLAREKRWCRFGGQKWCHQSV